MKYPFALPLPAFAVLTALLTLATPISLRAQPGGSLDPSSGPGKSMKSLDQAEPRIPLVQGAPGTSLNNGGGFFISQPGSYYLTENLTVVNFQGIVIAADNVTIDLQGFTITSTDDRPNSEAISVEGNGVTIFNGIIDGGGEVDDDGNVTGNGFREGIVLETGARNIQIRDIIVKRLVGGVGWAIDAWNGTVQSCIVTEVSSAGINAGIVTDCFVSSEGRAIIATNAENCSAECNSGLSALYASRVQNCWGWSKGSGVGSGNGISGIVVHNSTGSSESGHGIEASKVSDSRGISTSDRNSDHGIDAEHNVTNSSGYAEGGVAILCGYRGRDQGSITNSVGFSTSNDGIACRGSVETSYGYSQVAVGIRADGTVSNSNGISEGDGSADYGILSKHNVINSLGKGNGGSGIRTHGLSDNRGNVSNSYGYSVGEHGIYCDGNVTNSYGFTQGLNGINADGNVSDSKGESEGSADGIHSNANVSNSEGFTQTGEHGIEAGNNVMNSHGESRGTGHGITAGGNVSNSEGYTKGADGIRSNGNVENSEGRSDGAESSGHGINADWSVTNSVGITDGKNGINANIISYSHGKTTAENRVGLKARIGVACTHQGGEEVVDEDMVVAK